MSLLIRNGEIVNVGSRGKGDIFVENETITQIGQNLEVPRGAEVVDATGKLVFPGFIDPHVHIYLPFMATFAKDTHETASIAALVGGTTTYIEMCCPNRNDDALEGYQLWKSKAEGKSACDYAFHMSVTKFVNETESQLREIVADGTASFKIFLAYKNFFGVDDGEM
ncbi:MAG TPA: amidohydrolase family protein, partial [Candidatus Sulfotelmatobacter sp.]|nr:amidohydrolase family protein [Candidatus Sulfotelmatobacter sp.]